MTHRDPAIPDSSLRGCFPALASSGDQPPLVYLDSATTTLPPQVVLDRVLEVMAAGGGAHRSVHRVGMNASKVLNEARQTVAEALAAAAEEIVFVRSATEGIHLVAEGFAAPQLGPGDEVCISRAEHHSNVLPWRRVCQASGARCVVIECDERGDLDLRDLRRKLSAATRVLALTHVSNVTGAVTPLRDVADILRSSAATAAIFAVDGAQAVAHLALDVSALGCDFYTFSGHKVYGPPGVGVVWGRADRWAAATPHLVGGGMVASVGEDSVEFVNGPAKFEAGTPNVAGAAGCAAGLRFLASQRLTEAHEQSSELAAEAAAVLGSLDGVRVLGNPAQRVGAVTFSVDGVHSHDLGGIADAAGVAVRAGHMCAEPLLRHFGVNSAVRASFGVYNVRMDVDALVAVIQSAQSIFRGPERGVAR